jgi:hypothetical protein
MNTTIAECSAKDGAEVEVGPSWLDAPGNHGTGKWFDL